MDCIVKICGKEFGDDPDTFLLSPEEGENLKMEDWPAFLGGQRATILSLRVSTRAFEVAENVAPPALLPPPGLPPPPLHPPPSSSEGFDNKRSPDDNDQSRKRTKSRQPRPFAISDYPYVEYEDYPYVEYEDAGSPGTSMALVPPISRSGSVSSPLLITQEQQYNVSDMGTGLELVAIASPANAMPEDAREAKARTEPATKPLPIGGTSKRTGLQDIKIIGRSGRRVRFSVYSYVTWSVS